MINQCKHCNWDIEYDNDINEWVHCSTGEEFCEDEKHNAEPENKILKQ